VQFLFERLHDCFAHSCGVHGLGQDLYAENVAIAIDDQAGQEIGFAEDDAVGVRICDEFVILAVSDGGANALRNQSGQIGHRSVRDHADRDLRRGTVERGSEKLAAWIENADDGAGRHVFFFGNIRAINPRVARLQAGGSAEGEFYKRLRVLRRVGAFFRHGFMLYRGATLRAHHPLFRVPCTSSAWAACYFPPPLARFLDLRYTAVHEQFAAGDKTGVA